MNVITHRFNIGGNANILRAYEYGERVYKWIVCDDDELHFEHADELVEAIESGKYDIIRVSDVGVMPGGEGSVRSLGDLLHDQEGCAFWSFGFVPGIIFRSAAVIPSVKYGYYHVHTAYQHLFILLRSFGLDARVYTTVKPALVRGAAPMGIGSMIFSYWLRSLEALPDEESRRAALRCIFRGGVFKLGRSIVGDIRCRRPHRAVWEIWKEVFGLAPTIGSKLTILLNLPFVLIPLFVIKLAYPMVKGKPFVEIDLDDIRKSRE
jgi:hypothetical protein